MNAFNNCFLENFLVWKDIDRKYGKTRARGIS